VIATHSPMLMAYPDARIHLLDRQGIRDVASIDTEHHRVTRRFPGAPGRSLERLLGDATEAEPDGGTASP